MKSTSGKVHWKKFAKIFSLDHRAWRCFHISVAVHFFFLIFFYLFVLPAGGDPEADLLSIGFESSFEESSETDRSQENSSDVPLLEEKTISEEAPVDLKEMEEEYQEIIESFDDGVEEYQEKRKKMLEAKKQHLAQLKASSDDITKNISMRSNYGTLAPKTFYGVRIFAKSMIFVLDTSGSMDFAEGKRQLKNAYRSLNAGENFTVVIYADRAVAWQDTAVPATEENKEAANLWLDKTPRVGYSTNIHEAVRTSFSIAKRSKVDTIYFLSDGLPSLGEITDPIRLLHQIRLWNASSNIIIHTIGLGSAQDHIFLGKMAEDNRGKYYVR